MKVRRSLRLVLEFCLYSSARADQGLSLEQTDPFCVSVMMTSGQSSLGGEVGINHL